MISIVIPIYNEEELIARLNDAVASALKGVVDDWEVVYVNDGSTDSSLELLKGLQAVDSHVVVVDLSRNWGHMGAISAGLQTARGHAVILMDGDFQDPPQVLPRLIEAWRDGAEVVVGVRRSRQESRKILAALFPLFYRVLGTLSDYPIPLNAGIFSLMDRKAVDSIVALREKNRYLPGLARLGGLQELRLSTTIGTTARRRWKALVPQPHQVRDGRNHQLQLQASAAELWALWVLDADGCLSGSMHVPASTAVSTAAFGIASAVFFVGGLCFCRWEFWVSILDAFTMKCATGRFAHQ